MLQRRSVWTSLRSGSCRRAIECMLSHMEVSTIYKYVIILVRSCNGLYINVSRVDEKC